MMEMGIRKYGFTRGLTCLIFVFILCGCASTKGIADKSGELSSEDRRKFDYFYLEAERLKAIGENDAAFDLMSRAADLDTTSAAALFLGSILSENGVLRAGEERLAICR